jgi:hypothetical protein
MTATDRLRLSPELEAKAQKLADDLGRGRYPERPINHAFLLGYLEEAVAVALERPRWASRDDLRVDLRAVQIVGRHE